MRLPERRVRCSAGRLGDQALRGTPRRETTVEELQMQFVLRAYDRKAVFRAESLPVQQLWTTLSGSGLWDRTKVRVGLREQPDVYARETVVARLESLVQEGHGDQSLHYLRGADPPTLASLRRAHWPVIGEEEAVLLREDMVRYLTYGLWQAPEDVLGHALGLLTGRGDASVMVSSIGSTGELQEILSAVEDRDGFAEAYGPTIQEGLRSAGLPADDATLAQELGRLEEMLAPVQGLLRGAASSGLAVIVYREEPGAGDGLSRHIASAMRDEEAGEPAENAPTSDAYDDVVYSNGRGEPPGEL